MERHHIIIERAAEIALNFLLPSEREQVMEDLLGLSDKPFAPEADNTHDVEGPQDLLVLPTLGRLRVVYTRGPDGTIVVQDVVNQGIIDRYFRKAAPVA